MLNMCINVGRIRVPCVTTRVNVCTNIDTCVEAWINDHGSMFEHVYQWMHHR